jgi:hypothetical protein
MATSLKKVYDPKTSIADMATGDSETWDAVDNFFHGSMSEMAAESLIDRLRWLWTKNESEYYNPKSAHDGDFYKDDLEARS